MAPVLLVQKWVQDTYGELCDRRGWWWLKGESALVIADARSITGGVTLGSASATSAALFLATDVGRQVRVGTYPLYTIIAVDGTLSIATLDRAYQDTTNAAATLQILDAYLTMPEDFGRFEMVVSVSTQRRLPWWISQEEVNQIDPVRSASGTVPRIVAAASPSPVVATLGYLRYEVWPLQTSAVALPYLYRKRPQSLSDSDAFQGVLRDRGDVIEAGALAKAAMWPGLENRRNPYFSLPLARDLKQEFESSANRLDLRDDDQDPQSYSQWVPRSAWAWAYDTDLLRDTDASADGYGYGAGGY